MALRIHREWCTVAAFLDINSILSLRQTCSTLRRLIDKDNNLWFSLIQRDFPSPRNTHPELLQLAEKLHKSLPALCKQQYIAKYFYSKRESKKTAQSFANVYNGDLFLLGSASAAFFSLPFFLFYSSHTLPLITWILLSLQFTVLGCVFVFTLVWRHANATFDFFVATGGTKVSRLKYIPISVYSALYQYFHPLTSLHSLNYGLIRYVAGVLLIFYLIFSRIPIDLLLVGSAALYPLRLNPAHPFNIRRPALMLALFSSSLGLWDVSVYWRALISLSPILLHFISFYLQPSFYRCKLPRVHQTPPPSVFILLTFFICCIILPVFSVFPIAVRLAQLGWYSYPFSFALVNLHLLISATIVISFGVYVLLCIGEYRWWWISYLAPTIAAFVTLQLIFRSTCTPECLLLSLFYASLVGSAGHSFVSYFLIGRVILSDYDNGGREIVHHPELENILSRRKYLATKCNFQLI